MAENLEKGTEAQKVNEDALKAEGAEAALTADRKRLVELKAAFPEDVAFAYEQYEAGASVETAKANYADVLSERLKVAEAKIADADKKLAASTEGADPVDFQEAGNADASDFMKMSRARAKKDESSMRAAMLAVSKENPEVHKSFLDTQPKKKMQK